MMLSGDFLFFPIFIILAAFISKPIADIEIKMIKSDFGDNPRQVLSQLGAVKLVGLTGSAISMLLLFTNQHDLIIFASAGSLTVFSTTSRVIAHFSKLYQKN